MKYRFLDEIKSDVMFEAYGSSLKELFENAAEAMLSVVCKIKKVKPEKTEEFEIKGQNLEELMINWLQGIISIIDVEEMFFSSVEVEEVDKSHVRARLKGEPIRPELGATVVKAVTYYKYKLKKTENGYLVRVSLDI